MFLKFLLRRIVQAIPMLFIITLCIYSLILLIPGDPVVALLGENATPERIQSLHKSLGLDQNIAVQYFDWLFNALRGDLGNSIFTGQPIIDAVSGRLPVTFQLVVVSMIMSIGIGMSLAILSISYPNSLIDHIARFFGTLGAAVPNFWIGLVFVLVFSLTFGWFPTSGFVSITENPIEFARSVFLPALALGLVGMSQIMRHLRSALIEVMESDYIRTGYSKGIGKWRAIFVHGLQNAMLPVVTTIGILFGKLMGSTVVIETVFGIPGMGQLAVNAILQRDFTMIQGIILVMIVVVIVVNLITDIVYSLLDPRIEY